MHNILILIVASATTLLIRALPFMLFGNGEKTSPYILYLGDVLPSAIMMMLIVYCLKDTNIMVLSELLPALIAVIVTAALQFVKHNTLFSIVTGTICYMVLIQLVFI